MFSWAYRPISVIMNVAENSILSTLFACYCDVMLNSKFLCIGLEVFSGVDCFKSEMAPAFVLYCHRPFIHRACRCIGPHGCTVRLYKEPYDFWKNLLWHLTLNFDLWNVSEVNRFLLSVSQNQCQMPFLKTAVRQTNKELAKTCKITKKTTRDVAITRYFDGVCVIAYKRHRLATCHRQSASSFIFGRPSLGRVFGTPCCRSVCLSSSVVCNTCIVAKR